MLKKKIYERPEQIKTLPNPDHCFVAHTKFRVNTLAFCSASKKGTTITVSISLYTTISLSVSSRDSTGKK